jgi:WD40 repeat protein
MVYIWDVKKKKLIASLGESFYNIEGETLKSYGHLGQVNEVVWSTYDTILSSSDDCSVIVWNVLY